MLASPPAYYEDTNKFFVQTGSRWSHTTDWPEEKYKEVENTIAHYPFYIGYSSSLLKREVGVDVLPFDACGLKLNKDEFVREIIDQNPDLLLVEIPTISFDLTMPLLKRVKDKINCKLAISGFHVTALWERAMEKYPFIDFSLLGEYEITLKELVASMENGGNFSKINGLVFRKEGELEKTKKRELIKNLDDLPFPDRDSLPVENCYGQKKVSPDNLSFPIWTSRGCPFGCSFCVERQVLYGCSIYRKRSPEKIVDEMEECFDKYGADQIDFDDMSMTVDKKHVEDICKEIIKRGRDMPWASMGDMNVDYETMKLMKEAGCGKICFGLETVDPDSLKNAGKEWVNVEKAEKFVKNCRDLEIISHATYTIGLPGDTEEKINATINFSKKLNTDTAQWSIATPYPGTPFFERAKKKGWLVTYDWSQYDGNRRSVLSYPQLSRKKIEKLYWKAQREWKNHVRKRKIKNPHKTIPELLKRIKKNGIKNSLKIALGG